MHLKITESKNARSLYVIRSTYNNGKHSSEIVKKLGTYAPGPKLISPSSMKKKKPVNAKSMYPFHLQKQWILTNKSSLTADTFSCKPFIICSGWIP